MVAPNQSSPVSARKLRANRRNAKKSTGPRSAQGKARSSRNATTHGIFCRHLFLAGEDAELFHMTRNSFICDLKPHGAAQLALVDGMFAARWRLNRCQGAEASLLEERVRDIARCVERRLESLQRSMRLDDFSSVAIAAQCERSELFASYYQQWRDLRALQRDGGLGAGPALAALLQQDEERALERLSHYEQRLHGQFHRSLRDLHVLKQKAKEYAEEEESEFLMEHVPAPAPAPAPAPPAEEEEALAQDAQATEDDEMGEAETDDDEIDDAPAAAQVATAAAEDEVEKSNVKNEPTAAEAGASSAPAETSQPPPPAARPEPDPAEMRELEKITESLGRCRRDPMFGPF